MTIAIVVFSVVFVAGAVYLSVRAKAKNSTQPNIGAARDGHR